MQTGWNIMIWPVNGLKAQKLWYLTKIIPYQRDNKDEEPGVQEKVCSADLNYIDQRGNKRKSNSQGNDQFLHKVLEEKPNCLQDKAANEIIGYIWKMRWMCDK